MNSQSVTAAFLTLLLTCGTAGAADKDIRNVVSHIPPGAHVELQTIDGVRTRGHIGATTDAGFTFRTDDGSDRSYRFDEIKRVRTLTYTHPLAWIAVGVIAAVVVIAVVIFAVERHNERK